MIRLIVRKKSKLFEDTDTIGFEKSYFHYEAENFSTLFISS